MNLLEQVTDILKALTPMVGFLLGTGALQKWLPFITNNIRPIIPFLNTLVAFLVLFATPQANASVLHDVGKAIGFPSQLLACGLLSWGVSKFHDGVLKEPVDLLAGWVMKKIAPKQSA